ncbi:nicotinate phosphoribosyltransferase, subgroup A [Campylobacter blaseri]|uniref:Nicotinate phosphoribosyltransferase n=1 Tax=Campylobacter blaseri TaxID=2042961 RepID=A0A2P8R407_9BACT|nr:nicotinate phosphoribosyltransferase [Campylobacter blaseri]PSM53247.1 nicotinate phosphoribosyltransferase [Campylobacter blaseri]PSM54713.1 nicotinate phosphoribosyltransferase [Campylobacter blaseri]QKF86803.1 nicotinate phosphoribosyltransferase, subgroup A [Campylobacter blaseri]
MNNFGLFTDFYQLSMMQGYFKEKRDSVVVFDCFFRKHPFEGGYTIICGINEVVEYIQNLKFSDEDIEYLRTLNSFDDDFLQHLKTLKFSGEIYAMKEGSIAFAHEPIIRVKANILEAQLIETAILNIVNFQTLIATKSSRVVESAKGGGVMEFGLRRAQARSAGLYGSKAAIVGGCVGTSNVEAAKKFGLKVIGTHSHSWVQSFNSELESFRAYAKCYPNSTLLLIDTYNVLNSGLPNAITVFKELREKGYKPLGVRLDSGDLEYLSKEVRKALDAEGFKDAKITASNDLDEHLIEHLLINGAKIDNWGVGTRLITAHDSPSLGGVYKLSGVLKDGKIEPKMKISNDPRKINNPGLKQVYRLYDKDTDKAIADLITLDDEVINNDEIKIFHPLYTYKRKIVKNFYAKKLLKPLFIDGKFVGKMQSVKEIAKFAKEEKESMWEQYLRNIKPQTYKVDLSQKLWDIRESIIQKHKPN